MRATLRNLAAAGVIAVLVLLAACGDDGEGKSGAARLRILVTNDDGVAAEGIDALVTELASDPHNQVVVCAPIENRSGSSDSTGPSGRCGDLTVAAATTRSGYEATAIDGCPADAVLYALANLFAPQAPPHVVISGINEGQNVSEPIALEVSGTVGAALVAARHGIPAAAVSQGVAPSGFSPDYAAAVAVIREWLEERRADLVAGKVSTSAIDNINVPTCTTGSIRGILREVPLAPTAVGAFGPQDCTSAVEAPRNDVEAFVNGFVTISAVPAEEAG